MYPPRVYNISMSTTTLRRTVPQVVFLPPKPYLPPRDAAGIMFIEATSGRVLLSRRAGGVTQSGSWGIPGGLLDRGEDPDEAAFRELREELGITLDFVSAVMLGITEHLRVKDGRGGTFTLYRITVPDGSLPLEDVKMDHETSAVTWILPEDALVSLKLHTCTELDLLDLLLS